MEQAVCGCRDPSPFFRDRAGPTRPDDVDATPVRGLAGSELARQFRYWRGRSGRRYLFSIFPLSRTGLDADALLAFENAVVLAVALGSRAGGTILAALDTGAWPAPDGAGPELTAAIDRGADEVHVHLLTRDAAERAAIRSDLAG